jgi:hypothetical protein
VVRINAHINPEGRTIQGLGREREGSGIVIDSDAEVVDNNGHTVPADVVGYDHESGFGLLRAIEPLKLKPMALGKSAENGDIVPRQALTRALAVVIGFGGILLTGPVAGIAVNAMRTTLTDGGKR